MKMYGSLVNRIQENSVIGQPIPTVGMGVTILGYSDRHPGTIIEVSKTGRSIKLQEDNWVRVDKNGMSSPSSPNNITMVP